jgi:hypothetical protein
LFGILPLYIKLALSLVSIYSTSKYCQSNVPVHPPVKAF